VDAIVRAVVIYFFLLVLMRLAGRTSLGQMTPFDLVLLLIVAETVGPAILGDDISLTNSFLAITTLIGMGVLLTALTNRLEVLDRWVNDRPLLIIENGRVIGDRLKKSRVDMDTVMEQARQSQGVERLDQIKYAVLERSGSISIIPSPDYS
jgi:uncharacterized membrane protein YcaP (DUF421 family)